jgi:hypothetical protein
LRSVGSALAALVIAAIAVIASACAQPRAADRAVPVDAPRVRLWIGGDVFLGAGGHAALAGIAEIVSGAPGIVNLEGPVGAAPDRDARNASATSGAARDGPLRLLHAPGAIGELRAPGVAVAGIANNHARDAGPGGGTDTMRALAAAGVQAAGGPAGAAVLTLGRLRVVVTAHDLEAGVPAGLGQDLAAARRRGDALIATFHVTGPASYLPRPELVDAVAIALDAGAIVIAAHGSHELARVERRGGAVIAWGLGNLAFDCACTDEDAGALLEVELGPGTPPSAGPAGSSRSPAAPSPSSSSAVVTAISATIIPIDAGLLGGAARLAADPALTFELLEALGSSHLERHGGRASF